MSFPVMPNTVLRGYLLWATVIRGTDNTITEEPGGTHVDSKGSNVPSRVCHTPFIMTSHAKTQRMPPSLPTTGRSAFSRCSPGVSVGLLAFQYSRAQFRVLSCWRTAKAPRHHWERDTNDGGVVVSRQLVYCTLENNASVC